MKRYINDYVIGGFVILLLLAIAAFFLGGCQVVPVTVVVTATPRTVTATPDIPTTTISASTSTPMTTTTVPEPTETIVPATPLPMITGNLLRNPDFEDDEEFGYPTEVHCLNKDCVELFSPSGWDIFYKDQPYVPEKVLAPMQCALGQTTGCNPPVYQGRPEFLPIRGQQPYSGNMAFQWFLQFYTYTAGIKQNVDVELLNECTLEVYVRQWWNPDAPTGPDDNIATYWQLGVIVNGAGFPFTDSGVLRSERFYVPYDKWVKLSYTFPTMGSNATVFIENTQVWPTPSNDKYVDYASLVCSYFPTPTPIVP